jgi:hypothetical protein
VSLSGLSSVNLLSLSGLVYPSSGPWDNCSLLTRPAEVLAELQALKIPLFQYDGSQALANELGELWHWNETCSVFCFCFATFFLFFATPSSHII